MRLTKPFPAQYLHGGHTCHINQLFGENKNRLFYGPLGHTGIDFKTQIDYKYRRVGNWKWDIDKGRWSSGEWKREHAADHETQGYIPTIATHDGMLSTNFFRSDHRNGYAVYVTSDVMQEDDTEVQYQTKHFHIEKPWRSLSTLKWRAKIAFKPEYVKRGSIIAVCNNSGKYTTGAHLHFTLSKRYKLKGQWTPWEKIDPMPYFDDHDVIYKRFYGQSFYKGKPISNQKRINLLKSWPQVKS